jgi:hypothetical protein
VRRHALFFTDPSCRAMYRAHVAALAGRRSSVTGQLYRDDPTIMAWDLINEPRCESWAVPECPQMLQVRGLPAAACMPYAGLAIRRCALALHSSWSQRCTQGLQPAE